MTGDFNIEFYGADSHLSLCLRHVILRGGLVALRGLLEKYLTFGREKETGLLGALDT